MRALVVKSPNVHSLDQLEIIDRPQPTAKAGQVLVKVHAVGLNPVDYKLVEGGVESWIFPHILGLDVAGEIVALGSGVQGFQVGERVSGHGNLMKDGCFADYVAVPTYQLTKIPANVTYEQAAALLCGTLTAYTAINRKANLTNVKTVLVHAGAGGVGSLAIQFAKLHGFRVLTTVSARKKDFVQQLHPDAIIDYQHEDVSQRVAELTDGLGADLIIDTVGKAEATKDIKRLSYNGTLVTIVDVPEMDAGYLFDHAINVATVNLGGAHLSANPTQQADLGKMNAEVLQLMSQGKIDPMIERVLPFEQIADGLKMLKDRQVKGKLVVRL